MEFQSQVMLPAVINQCREVREPMTGQRAWEIIQNVDRGLVPDKAMRQNIYDKENSKFLYWARVFVREVYPEAHHALDELFFDKGYHRLRDDHHADTHLQQDHV